MSFEAYVALGCGVFAALVIIVLIIWKAPRRIKPDKFADKWQKLQQRCADKTQWPQAIADADNLLDEALRKRRVKGKSMGERLVAAQKDFTNNDGVWFGHKLRTKLDLNPELTLSKEDVQKALIGLRQALKDLGVLR